MAFHNFSDITGEAEKLSAIDGMPNKEFAARWPGVKGFRYDGYQMWVGRSQSGDLMPVTRRIEYKARPSLHECNAKCLNGKHSGTCECRCGGKNHGRGMFTKMLEAA
ncbi:hypothetical protein [Delftia acidovorans]|uniref:hypothetical protein n=1 Tax=Delftia acidovorans TaxID=80866 RepID=UPI00286F6440|nr:hypothetical protein [Delftia acidovorans]